MKSSNNKILTIAVVLLLLANIALVAYMIMGNNKRRARHGGKGDPAEMMAKELDMTEQQKKDHKQLKEEHFKNIKPQFDSVRAAKIAYYSLMKDSSVSDSTLNIYSQRISEKQSIIDKLTFAHFKRIRNLFTVEQKPRFDAFIQKMMQRGRKDSAARKEKE